MLRVNGDPVGSVFAEADIEYRRSGNAPGGLIPEGNGTFADGHYGTQVGGYVAAGSAVEHEVGAFVAVKNAVVEQMQLIPAAVGVSLGERIEVLDLEIHPGKGGQVLIFVVIGVGGIRGNLGVSQVQIIFVKIGDGIAIVRLFSGYDVKDSIGAVLIGEDLVCQQIAAGRGEDNTDILCLQCLGEGKIEGVFAGGDVAPVGTSNAINAMGAGKRAAKAINEYLKK